jgi:hypothetical protein
MIGAQFAPNIPLAQKIVLDAPMLLLGDEAQAKAYFGIFGDSANLNVR